MLGRDYALYHIKMQGYLLQSSTYGTDITRARTFTEDEAIEFARRARAGDGSTTYIPVHIGILNAIMVP